MNNIQRLLITVTLTVATGSATAAQMQDEMDSPKPDFRTGAVIDDTRGARPEDVLDRPGQAGPGRPVAGTYLGR